MGAGSRWSWGAVSGSGSETLVGILVRGAGLPDYKNHYLPFYLVLEAW